VATTPDVETPPGKKSGRLPLIALGLVLVAAVVVYAMRTTPDRLHQSLPQGLWLAADTIDLGTLSTTSDSSGAFRIENHGSLTYHIDKVSAECGCMSARSEGNLLKPQTGLSIPVVVHGPAWGDGLRTKNLWLSLTDNYGMNSTILLHVTGAINHVASLAIIPNRIDLAYGPGNVSPGFSLFVRGDAAVVDRLPSAIALSDSPETHIRVAVSRLEGRRASREIGVSLQSVEQGITQQRLLSVRGL
jgi:hypothetical protein